MEIFEIFHWTDNGETRKIHGVDPLMPFPMGSGAAALVVLGLGIVAGLTTTVAGVGGGLVLTLALSPLVGPHAALAVAAVPLVLGNAHRMFLFRRYIDRRVVTRIGIGIVPGVAIGTWLINALSPAALQTLLLITVALAALRELSGKWVERVGGHRLLIPGGVALGFTSASAGAGGLIAGPLLLAANLRDAQLVAAAATIGVIVNTTRVTTYTTTGLLAPAHLPTGAVLTLALILGNTLGHRLRPHLTPRTLHATTWLVILTATTLALAGV